MAAIVERLHDRIRPVVTGWDTVDTVTCLSFGSDRLDPGFFVSYDCYYHGTIPAPEERADAFSFAGAFESSVDARKDRFLLDDVAVRLEYKAISDVDLETARARNPERGEVLGSTYRFYRVMESETVHQVSRWLPVVRNLLEDLPEEFWVARTHALRARMEHAFSDLSTAIYAQEELFYQLSLARFLEAVTGLIFTVNRRFDPPGRTLFHELESLPRLPDEFSSRFQHLMRVDAAVSLSRKRQIAELLVRSLLQWG